VAASQSVGSGDAASAAERMKRRRRKAHARESVRRSTCARRDTAQCRKRGVRAACALRPGEASGTGVAAARAPMARAMWKASLEFGAVKLPVKLYAAAQDRDVHFRLLHAKDKAPVQQRMVDARSREPVASEEIRRGVELEKGLYVVLSEAELDSLAPEPSRAIEVTRFVPASAIDLAWYNRPYFLGPDGSAGDYAALVAALGDGGLRGVARWTMRGRRYFGALAAHDGTLALIALRPAEEVVPAAALQPPEGKAASAAERKLAEQLVAALDAPFEPSELVDEYRERVLALVRAKAKGRRAPAVAREAVPRTTSDLSSALERSLKNARKRRAA
jgi:DNA end-binding protein Ku